MKNFIKIVVITFCSALILWAGIELYQPYVLNEYTYKQRYIEDNGDQIKVLLLGNSYFFWSLNPKALGDSCFNAATNARWIYFDRVFLETRLQFMPNLTTVIYPIGYAIPYVGLRHHFEWTDSLCHHPLTQCYWHYKFLDIRYDGANKYSWHKTFQDRLGLDKINIKTLCDNRNCDELGWQPHKGDILDVATFDDTLTVDVINRKDMQENLEEYFAELTKIDSICTYHNIRLILVATPVLDIMKDALCPEAVDRVNEKIYQMLNNENTNMEFIDYLFDLDFRDDSLYYTCDHLNEIGATLFGKRLYVDLFQR